jgi:hypothetical protein
VSAYDVAFILPDGLGASDFMTQDDKQDNQQNDRLDPGGIAALQARFQQQSRRAQAYYNVMHEARRSAGGDDAANAWMNAPLAAFDGKTPAQLVNEGREEQVLDYLRR